MPKRDFETIRAMTIHMQNQRSPIVAKMLEVQRQYQADLVVPLPDLSNEPNMPNLTPQQMTDVIDGLARRAASVRPMVSSPAKNPFEVEGPGGQKYARDRERIINAVYGESGWVLARRRKARHENAYETCSIVVSPDWGDRKMPILELRSPLETFPEPRSAEEMRPASYVAFITRYSGDWLRKTYPMTRSEQGGPISTEDLHQLWDVVEWYDDDQIAMGLLGPVLLEGQHLHQNYTQFQGPWMPLSEPVQNKAGVCLAYTPHGVTLHSIGNRLNRLIENLNWQNRLMALDVMAQEKAIFPDMYVLGNRTGQQPQLVDGMWHDGREGVMNLVTGAEGIGTINQNPDPRTAQMVDRMQANFMRSSGLSPQMYGESHGAALRTGRALGQMAEASIDPLIQELHEMDEAWMPHVNEGILRAFQGWWPQKKYTMFSRWPGDTSELEFTPAKCIEGVYHNSVEYAIAGADIVQLTQVLGSLLGSNAISQETFQLYHPWIKNPQSERTKVETEQLDRALMEGLQQQVVSGQMPTIVFSRIRKLYGEGDTSLIDAIVQVDEEIRAEQMAAQEAAAQQQQLAGASAMPGLAAGPAAAAPGQMPPEMAMQGGPPPGAGGSPMDQMRQMMSGANPMGG